MNRIEHYATYLQGGAGAAARRIFDGICAEIESATGANSNARTVHQKWQLELLCRNDQPLQGNRTGHFSPAESFFARTWPRKWNRKSFKQAAQHYHLHLKNRPAEFEVFSPARLYEPTARDHRQPVDIVHLHWVAFLLDYPTFFRSLPAGTPVVWTLHDMNAFTGGCHYSSGCDRYLTGCGNCQQLANPNETDLSSVAWTQKKKAMSSIDMTVVAPSKWLTRLAKTSKMFSPNSRFETIHYGLDTEAYQPINRSEAKRSLGIDSKKITLLFGAADVSVPRKGFEPLLKALCHLPDPENYQCVVFGGGNLSHPLLRELSSKMSIKEIGFLEQDNQKRIAYSAADMFVLPSLEDNQPQTGLESLACQTPVVAFDAGGIGEYVQHGKTGLLAKPNDPENLAKQIRWLADSAESRMRFGQNGRCLVLSQFEVKQQTRKYLRLYGELLSQKAQRRQAG